MPAERFFYPHSLLASQEITLIDDEFHHLVRVMRAQIGDSIEVINGMGQLAEGSINSIEKKQATLLINHTTLHEASKPPLILCQAIPKMHRLEYILEKGTELGVHEFWLFPSKYSERKDFSDNQMTRMQNILIGAIKQCGRLWLPILKIMKDMDHWPCQMKGFFGDTSSYAPFLMDQLPSVNQQGILFCVGPESGFTKQEHQNLENKGLVGVKLHPNILRTDTAAITALSIISHFLSTSNA